MEMELVDLAKEMKNRNKRKNNLKKQKTILQQPSDWDQVCSNMFHTVYFTIYKCYRNFLIMKFYTLILF